MELDQDMDKLELESNMDVEEVRNFFSILSILL